MARKPSAKDLLGVSGKRKPLPTMLVWFSLIVSPLLFLLFLGVSMTALLNRNLGGAATDMVFAIAFGAIFFMMRRELARNRSAKDGRRG